MPTALLLLQLLEALLNPNYGPEQAAAYLGEPIEKTERRWRIRPRAEEFSDILLHFENIPAGAGLMTTIELRWKEPWRPSLADLRAVYGPEDRWLPATGKGRPRTLQFFWDRKPLKGLIMMTVARPLSSSNNGQLTVPKALVRRLFGQSSKADEP